MFNRKSSYALNKKDASAIVYIDANDNIIRLTREDFASEEEFQKWKSWSDENYHTEDNRDVVEGKHKMSIDDLAEAALAIPAIDVVMEHQHERVEKRRQASAMVSQIKDKLTETQFRRLWMYFVDGMTIDEIGEIEGISHQNISKSIGAAMKKIKKNNP
jgi:RNA polymerase sigma factor (sigma-70 family)